MSDEFDPFKDEKEAAKKAFETAKKKLDDNKTGAGLGALLGGALGAAITRGPKGAAAGGALGAAAGTFISDQIRKGMPIGAGKDAPPPGPRVKPPVDLWKNIGKKKPEGENEEAPKKKDEGNGPEPGPGF